MISGSILTTDWLTPSNVGQGENYCKKFDPERFRGRYRFAADPFGKFRQASPPLQEDAFRLAAETDRLAACAPQKIRRWKWTHHFNIIAAYGL
jgi:hypothetical protein